MILVDTSAWIEFFRGRQPLAQSVDELLESGEAAICGPIATELRRGLRPAERSRVLALLEGCEFLAQPDDLWTTAGDLGAALARRGATVKTIDLLIATHAIAHGVALLSRDADFTVMSKARLGLLLV